MCSTNSTMSDTSLASSSHSSWLSGTSRIALTSCAPRVSLRRGGRRLQHSVHPKRTTKLAGSDASTAPPNSARSSNANAAMLQATSCTGSGGNGDCRGVPDGMPTWRVFRPFPRAPVPSALLQSQPVRALVLASSLFVCADALLSSVGSSGLCSLQAAVERAKYVGGAARRKRSQACLAHARSRLAGHLQSEPGSGIAGRSSRLSASPTRRSGCCSHRAQDS